MTRAKPASAALSLVVTQYETLRRAALGEALPPEARAGLMLFLRRGMWGWSQAVTTRSPLPPPAGSRPLSGKRPAEDKTLIQLFAALASQATS